MIDTHTHLYSEEFDEDRTEMIKRAINKGVTEFYLPAIDSESHEKMLQLELNFLIKFCNQGASSLLCKARNLGKRIRNCRKLFEEKDLLLQLVKLEIDLFWDKTTLDIQVKAFEKQIDWAIMYDVPIVIHTRESFDETFEVLEKKKTPKIKRNFPLFQLEI